MKLNCNKAFSLAEVLITLAIIGVVAQMTTTILLSSAHNKENIVALKKYYTTMDSSLKLYMTNNGCIGDLRICISNLSTSADLYNIFKPSLNVQKDCGIAANSGCFPLGVSYKELNPTYIWGEVDSDTNSYKVKLVDGVSFGIVNWNNNCATGQSRTGKGHLSHICGAVNVDVNGAKGPNQMGRDLFNFAITSSGIYPRGMLDDNEFTDTNGVSGCDSASTEVFIAPRAGDGRGCTAKVLQEDVMNY